MNSALPDHGILLHVGPHKTGTTAIQGALAAARPQLLAAGILYPGNRPEHNRQAAAATQRALGWEHRRVDRGQWTALADAARQYDGRAVISSEVFCEADPQAARQVVADLDPDRVQVVVTLRPLEKLLPSNWQQYIKSGYRVPYGKWLENVLESREKRPITPSFWLRNNHPEVIRRWSEAAGGPDRVTVVIVDSAKPRSLFNSFEDLLGLARNTLNADKSGPSNRSLSALEVELLRQLNKRARGTVAYSDYYRFVKRGAVLRLVEGRTPGRKEPRVTTPGWAIERAREFSKADVAAIGAMGVRILGDIDTLAPDTPVSHDEIAPVTSVPPGLAAAFMYDLLQAGIATSTAPRGEAVPAPKSATKPAAKSATKPGAKPATKSATKPARTGPAAPPETVGLKIDRAIARTRERLAGSKLASTKLADRMRAGRG
jgi:hypothetical protein